MELLSPTPCPTEHQGSRPNTATLVCVPTNTFIGDRRGNILVIGKIVPSVGRLIAVIQLSGEVGGVVGVQHCCAILVFDSPHNAIL